MKMSKNLLLVFGLLFGMSAYADHYPEPLVDVEIITDGDEAPMFDADLPEKSGVQRYYALATKGERYSLRVSNNSARRIGVVIAVDGRNIISGKKSHLRSSERMYILRPWQTAEYTGWRSSKNRVNRFYFTESANSYAEAWGDQTAMGVIAIAAFKPKRVKQKHVLPYQRDHKKGRHHSRSFKKAPTAESDSAGTGWGESEWSPSRIVKFNPRKRPAQKIFIKYEWRASLCQRGLLDCYQYSDEHRHNRFWPDDDLGYAPSPFLLRKLRWFY